MKLKITGIILVLFSVLGFGQTTFEFMKTDISARSAALGSSFTSNTDDPNVIFFNPAGLNFVGDKSASFSYTSYLAGINFASLSYADSLPGLFRFGSALKYANYGTFTRADEFGNRTGEFSANEFVFLLGGGGNLGDNFYYGSNVKFIFSKIDDRSSSALALDLGLDYYLPNDFFALGIAFTNMGTQLSKYYDIKEDLPFDISVGVSKRLAHLPLRFSLDFHELNKHSDNAIDKLKAFTLGAEFTLSKVLTLRFGYDNEKRKDTKMPSYSGITGFSGGVGIKVKTYQFDYGYSSMGLIGGIHRISLSTSFN